MCVWMYTRYKLNKLNIKVDQMIKKRKNRNNKREKTRRRRESENMKDISTRQLND